MTARKREPLRLRSALITAGLSVLSVVTTALLAPELGAPLAAVIGLIGAAATGAVVWAVLAPLSRLSAAAWEVAEGQANAATFPDGFGELASFTAVIHELANREKAVAARLAETETGYRADLTEVAAALAALADPKVATPTPTLSSRFTEQAEKVRSGFTGLGEEVHAVRHRVNTAFRILNALPDVVVVTDAAGLPLFLNSAAERAFGVASAAAQRKPIAALLADPIPAGTTGNDPDRAVAGAAEVMDWVRSGPSQSVVVRTQTDTLLELSGAVSRKNARDVFVCLVGRDQAAARHREAEERAAVRANATHRLLDRYLDESGEPLRQIGAQLRLLVGDAKQSGQRDAMLNKLTIAVQSLHRVDTFHTLAQWFRDLIWSGLPAPTPSEFTAVEVANLVAERLGGRLKPRGNSLKVIDQGGWLYADADRLEVALLGALAHACDASTNAQIEVRIQRLAAAPDRPVPVTEFHIPDAGPALTPSVLAVIEHPFGDRAPAPLGRFEGINGCPLGLVVAFWMADTLGGQLLVDSPAGGPLGLRLSVPTRLAGEPPPVTVATAAPGALDVAPFEETVAGWRLGASSAHLPA